MVGEEVPWEFFFLDPFLMDRGLRDKTRKGKEAREMNIKTNTTHCGRTKHIRREKGGQM